jgi:23S rRNA A2030 N6-methylase RlmJ
MKVLKKKAEAAKVTSLLEISGQLSDMASGIASYSAEVASGIIQLVQALEVVAELAPRLDSLDKASIKKHLEGAFYQIGSMGYEFPGIRALASLINKF